MRRLFYSSGYVLTADRTCKAVLRYARALAESSTSDVVSIPVLVSGGGVGYAHFLIGPASQLFSTPVADNTAEPDDPTVVADLERRTRLLQTSVPEWDDEMTDVENFDFDAI
ncbi:MULTISPECIES: hypothetical protein [unclassified Leifsonia]|uniref:hypothetical protein n=1 Tax=unclassified Leifsonia TaxID=2663824 RepID=UPI0006F3DF39|nr:MULTISPECIES: hypothetical protein [unclassified Leifsonia]KQX06906.1 hypothetical protein ASC59_03520 [Leifsonia sp. Root1293]KRA11191.1 hypothetical protein ASD61_03520 [Leifsonia sp. Root60]